MERHPRWRIIVAMPDGVQVNSSSYGVGITLLSKYLWRVILFFSFVFRFSPVYYLFFFVPRLITNDTIQINHPLVLHQLRFQKLPSLKLHDTMHHQVQIPEIRWIYNKCYYSHHPGLSSAKDWTRLISRNPMNYSNLPEQVLELNNLLSIICAFQSNFM